MIGSKQVLAVALARAGSKGLPGKNVRDLCGKPPVGWVIDAAKGSSYVDRVILSTDGEDIAEAGRLYGAETPFMEPDELAQSNIPDAPVFQYTISWLKNNENYVPDIVVHLRPTGPLLTSKEIDAALELLEKHPEADSVRSVELPPKPPFKMWTIQDTYMKPFVKEVANAAGEIIKDAHTAPRQSLPTVYQTTPDIGLFRVNTLLEKQSTIGDIVLPFILNRQTVDIDNEIDWEIAEYLFKNRRN